MQEIRELAETAKEAQQKLVRMDQAQVDRIVRAVADAGMCNARRLAQMADEDTGFGIVGNRMIENIFANRGVYEHVKDMRITGKVSRDDAKRLRTTAVPVDVIVGLIPPINPIPTALYKTKITIKASNAIVFFPHPAALRYILETVRVIRQAVTEMDGNENLVSCITIPTVEVTDNLIRHRNMTMILITGSSTMVWVAYFSGTPVIDMGPGNGPVYLEKTRDLPLAVKCILDPKTFDNGTTCASEQLVICDGDMMSAVKAEMERQRIYFLDDGKREKLGRFILWVNGTVSPETVGRGVKTITNLTDLGEIPATVRVLVAKETGVGHSHPCSNKELGPILAFCTAKNYEKVCEKVRKILHYEGAGHIFSMHTNDDKVVDYFAHRVPTSRVMVNTPSVLSGIGGTTALQPTLALDCGVMSGPATSENMGPAHPLNLRYTTYGLKELDEIRASVPGCSDGVYHTALSPENIDVDDIVRQIINRLQKL